MVPSPCNDASISNSNGWLKFGWPSTGAVVKQAFRRSNASFFGLSTGKLVNSILVLVLLLVHFSFCSSHSFDGLLDIPAGAII